MEGPNGPCEGNAETRAVAEAATYLKTKQPYDITARYAPGRGAVHGLKLLEGYRGIVQCDGYAAYKKIAATPGEAIMLAFCWAHLRRRFFDIAKGGDAPIASEALERIAALYAIEKTIRGRSADARRAVRQEKSKPLVLALKTWLDEQLARVSGKSVIAEAIRYGLNHWDGLTRFLEDGRIELDTNIVERGMRPIVLNRKNALFAGAENWAAIASLVEHPNHDKIIPSVLEKRLVPAIAKVIV